MTNNISFRDLAMKANADIYRGILIALDPGETTGYAVMEDLRIKEFGQLKTPDLDHGYDEINKLFSKHPNTRCICEDYRVYSWKTDQHTWAELHTPKFIGVIHALARFHSILIDYEMAVEAKTFCTDDLLERWRMYEPGMRHARDAIRHACYYSIFKAKNA